jgi:nucleoside-diphosphate-sugar epimerase
VVTRLLVTGAAGFVGAHLVRQALDAGYDVAAVVRPGATRSRLRDVVGDATGRSRGSSGALEVWEHDLAEARRLDASLGKWRPDVCIHLAWYAVPGRYLHAPENMDCLRQGLDLLEALASGGCRRVLMVGTCAEYDTRAGGPLAEDAPTRPETLYAATKVALAAVAEKRAAQLGVGFVWARLFWLYGPAEPEARLVPALIRALLDGQRFRATAGEQVRDYLHVADVASALLTLAFGETEGACNIGSGVPVALRELLLLAADLAGRPDLLELGAIPYRQWEPPVVYADVARLRATAWCPRYSLREGLAETVAWWRARVGERPPSSGEHAA